jgi:hypothetical protein
MAIKKASGMTANVTFITGHNLCPDMFRLSKSQTVKNLSCFGDTHRVVQGLLQAGTFTVQGQILYDGANTAPGWDNLGSTPAPIVFTFAPGCTVTVDGLIEEMNAVAVHGGDARIEFNGSTSGPFVEVWDETP